MSEKNWRPRQKLIGHDFQVVDAHGVRRRLRIRISNNMSKKLAPGSEIELPRLSSRGRSWRKAEAEAKAKAKEKLNIYHLPKSRRRLRLRLSNNMSEKTGAHARN